MSLVRKIIIPILLILTLKTFALDQCGHFKVAGDFECVNANCFIVTQPGTLSESYIKIENSKKLKKIDYGIGVVAFVEIKSILNSRQSRGDLVKVNILKQEKQNIKSTSPLLIKEKKCLK